MEESHGEDEEGEGGSEEEEEEEEHGGPCGLSHDHVLLREAGSSELVLLQTVGTSRSRSP